MSPAAVKIPAVTQRRILIVRTGGLGDTVLLWPALAAVRRRFPEAAIELMGNRERCALLVGAAGATLAVDIEGSGFHRLFEFGEEPAPQVRAWFCGYDVVVAFAAPGDYALAENLSACGVGEVHAFLPFPADASVIHAADHLRQTLIGAGLGLEGADPPLPLEEIERAEGRRLLAQADLPPGRTVLLAPGSGSVAKNWSAERFAEVAQRLLARGVPVALLAGPADEAATAAVVRALPQPAPVVLRPVPPVALKALLAASALLIGCDAGPTHLCALLGVPTVAIFGPSDPARWAPRGPRVRLLQRRIDCSPCRPEVWHDCQTLRCLTEVGVEDVIVAAHDLLQSC